MVAISRIAAATLGLLAGAVVANEDVDVYDIRALVQLASHDSY